MGEAAVEHHELLAHGCVLLAELAEAFAGRLAEDAEEVGGWCGAGHSEGGSEHRVVIDFIDDGADFEFGWGCIGLGLGLGRFGPGQGARAFGDALVFGFAHGGEFGF